MYFRTLTLGVLLTLSLSVSAKNVLAVHSYHSDFFWTDSLVTGLEKQLVGTGINVEHTYLDTKRIQKSRYRDQLRQLYKIRLEEQQYDAILTTDNAALSMVNELMPDLDDVPVVFSGLNVDSVDIFDNIQQLTGVEEVVNVIKNIELIQTAHPDVKRVWLVIDDSFSSQAYWGAIEKQLEKAEKQDVEIARLHGLTFDELITKASELDETNALLFISYFSDAKKHFMPHDILLSKITAASKLPIYGANSFMLPYGIIGGYLVDGEHHGEVQADLLIETLENGIAPPVIKEANQLILNYDAVKQYGVDLDHFPSAIVINKPLSFLEKNELTIKITLFICLISLVIIFLLTKHIKKQKRNERILAQSRALFKGMFDQSHQYIALLDYQGCVISANEAFRQLFLHLDARRYIPLWRWTEWVDNERLKMHIEAVVEGQVSRFELSLMSEMHHEVILDIAIKALPDHNDADVQLLFEARDITQRKLVEKNLQRSEMEYRMLYEQQPVMLMTIDSQSRIQSVNQCACEWLGYDKKDMLGHKISSFYAEDSASPKHILSTTSRQTTAIARREICYITKQKEMRWIRESVRLTPVKSQLLVVGEDITDNRMMEEQLMHQARHDFLTGLINRRYFEINVVQALNDVMQLDFVHAILFIDIDQFRVINDTVGHEAGDEALRQISALLHDLIPKNAVLGRLDGDEFAIIQYHCSDMEAIELGRQIIEKINSFEFYWENKRRALSCCIGIRMLDNTVFSAQQVHAQADTACYAAKSHGRGRLHLYRPENQELKRHEREMEFVAKIHEALAQDRFEIYAQPIVSLAKEDANSLYFEVLVRMREVNGEFVSPGDFIPAAERFNIASLIDQRVIEKTLSWFEKHSEYIEQLGLISINLSGRSMGDEAFIAFLLSVLKKSNIPMRCICLEITETAAIGHLTDATSLFVQLKELGCTIALDDFGSGLSSFGYLKSLPVDIIKIDGIFVRDIVEDETDFIMVRAIHQLASQMGKKTVAEFVENEAILKRLSLLGVNYAQGYHFSPPIPMADLVRHHTPKARYLKEPAT